MKFILSIHPVIQLTAIVLAWYAGYLGVPRILSLHFERPVRFRRELHALTGAISLVTLLGGMAGGYIMASRFLQEHEHAAMGLHESIALVLLPLLAFGIASGLYMYLKPGKRSVLPAVHALNNAIVLLLAIVQMYSGWQVYLTHVLS